MFLVGLWLLDWLAVGRLVSAPLSPSPSRPFSTQWSFQPTPWGSLWRFGIMIPTPFSFTAELSTNSLGNLLRFGITQQHCYRLSSGPYSARDLDPMGTGTQTLKTPHRTAHFFAQHDFRVKTSASLILDTQRGSLHRQMVCFSKTVGISASSAYLRVSSSSA